MFWLLAKSVAEMKWNSIGCNRRRVSSLHWLGMPDGRAGR